MPNRLIKESICTSDNLDSLSADEERFFYRLMVNCDDFGRFDGRPSILRARLFPLKLEIIKESHINKWLKSLIEAKLIYLYESNGLPYIQMITWENHQQIRARKSKYPEYDNNGNQMISNDIKCSRNPIQSNPNPIQLNKDYIKLFEVFWNEYPKKKAKQDALKAFLRLKPDEPMLQSMLSSLKLAKKSGEWKRDNGQYIPHPATWLNGKRWEDEIVEPKDGQYTGR